MAGAGGRPDLELRGAPVVVAAADLVARAGVGAALLAAANGSSQGTVGLPHAEVAVAPDRPVVRPGEMVANVRAGRQVALRPVAARLSRHPQPEQEVIRGGAVPAATAVVLAPVAVVERIRTVRLHAPRPGAVATECVVARVCFSIMLTSRVVRHAYRRGILIALRVERGGGRRVVRARRVAQRPLALRYAAVGPAGERCAPFRFYQACAGEQRRQWRAAVSA